MVDNLVNLSIAVITTRFIFLPSPATQRRSLGLGSARQSAGRGSRNTLPQDKAVSDEASIASA